MYRPIEIIQRPKLGQVRILHTYRVFYQSPRNGDDTFAVRVHWVQATTGKLQSAIVHYNIHVTDQPL
jgi:ABC-type phosphate/phosphonate transport system substrate-binding protein